MPAKPGPKPHQPTEQQRKLVRTMAGYGIPEAGIGKVVGLNEKTLRKYYREELDVGVHEANAAVAQSLFKMAMSGKNVVACIFWLKTRARWKEDRTLDLPPAKPEEVDFSQLTTEELRQWKALRAKAKKRADNEPEGGDGD